MKRLGLIVVWLVLCALLGYYAPTLPVVKDYISIKEVTVEGTDKLSEDDIKNLVKSESWFFISENKLKEKLKRYSFIKTIKLDKPVFGVVRIYITEKKPHSLVRAGDKTYLMDEDGNLIQNLSYYKDEMSNLKLITVDEEDKDQKVLKKIRKIEDDLKELNLKEFIIHKSVITAITEDDKIIILSKENIDNSINKFKIFTQKHGIDGFSYLNFSFDSMVIVKK